MMRAGGFVSVVVLGWALAACADATGLNIRPTITIAGLITNAMAQPVPNTDVAVKAYTPTNCGTGTLLEEIDAKSNTSGIYRVELSSLAATYSACIRVTVGTTIRDSTVLNLPQYSTVQMNISVP
ncbi:MAG TPA: hypothetical protein VG454_16360 [Gemmatimonadales bacterium]|nr:hypothetical protein [Gemmatimonadales bacterium]